MKLPLQRDRESCMWHTWSLWGQLDSMNLMGVHSDTTGWNGPCDSPLLPSTATCSWVSSVGIPSKAETQVTGAQESLNSSAQMSLWSATSYLDGNLDSSGPTMPSHRHWDLPFSIYSHGHIQVGEEKTGPMWQQPSNLAGSTSVMVVFLAVGIQYQTRGA